MSWDEKECPLVDSEMQNRKQNKNDLKRWQKMHLHAKRILAESDALQLLINGKLWQVFINF